MSDNLDPIELQFIINSPELLAEFQKIIASGGDVDQALSEMKQKYEAVKKSQKETGKETTSLADLMKKLGGEVVMSGGNVDVLTGSLGDFAGEVVESGNGIKILTKIKEGWLWITGGLTRGIMALGVAEGVATVATQVLMATITLGLSVAIVGLIVLLDSANEKLRLQEEFNKKVSDSVGEQILAYKALQSQWVSLGNDFTNKQKFVEDNQKEFKKLGLSINNVSDAEKLILEKSQDVINSYMLKAKAAAYMQIAVEKYKESLQKQMDFESKTEIMSKGFLGAIRDGQLGERTSIVWEKMFQSSSLDKQAEKAGEAANEAFMKSMQLSSQAGNFTGGTKTLSPVLQAMEKDDAFLQARFGAENKQYVEHHRKLLNSKINFYKDDKEEVSKYVQELRVFNASQQKKAEDEAKKAADERARNAETARKKALAAAQAHAEKLQSLNEKIAQKEIDLYAKIDANTSEEAKINAYFDKLEEEAKKLKANAEVYNKITLLRAAYLSNAAYKAETTKLLKELDNQRELYQAFETLKTKISETEASKRLGINYSEFQTYGQVLDEEIKKLTDKTKRSVEENARLKELQDRKTSYTTDQKQLDTNKFAEAYQATITYREQIESINKTYDNRALQLQTISDETLRKSKLAENEKQRKDAINSANAEAYEKLSVYNKLGDKLLEMTRKQLKDRIEVLKAASSDPTISPEQKSILEQKTKEAQKLLGNTSTQTKINQLLEERNRLEKTATGLTDKTGEEYLGIELRIKNINEELSLINFAKFFSETESWAGFINQEFSQLAAAIGDTNEGLSDTLQTIADIAGIAQSLASAGGNLVSGLLSGFTSGNIMGMVSGVLGAIGGIFSIGKKARESERKAREEIKKRQAEEYQAALDYNEVLRQRLIKEVSLNDLYKSSVDNIKEEQEARKKAAADNLKDQQNLFTKLLGMNAIVGEHTKKYGGFLGIGRKTKVVYEKENIAQLLGISANTPITDELFKKLEALNAKHPLTDDAKTAYEQLKKLRDEYGSIEEAQRQLEIELKNAVTGNTAQSFADGIIEGIKNGKKSFADFANDIEGYLRNALISGMSAKIIEPEMQKLQDALYEMMGDGILSADERKTFQDMYMKIVSSSQEYMDMINQAGVNISTYTSTSSANSLSGAIKGASQESIDLLGGQFGGMRLAQLEGNQILKTGFSGMMEQTSKMVQLQIDIEKNTRKTAENTEKLHDVNDNVEKVVDGQDKYYKALQAAGIIK